MSALGNDSLHSLDYYTKIKKENKGRVTGDSTTVGNRNKKIEKPEIYIMLKKGKLKYI